MPRAEVDWAVDVEMPLLTAVLHVAWDLAIRMLRILHVDETSRQELIQEGADFAVVANHVHQIHNGALSPEKYKLLNS